jgi:hypothetical protein
VGIFQGRTFGFLPLVSTISLDARDLIARATEICLGIIEGILTPLEAMPSSQFDARGNLVASRQRSRNEDTPGREWPAAARVDEERLLLAGQDLFE